MAKEISLENKIITIDLGDSKSSNKFKDENLVHQEAKRQFKSLLLSNINELVSQKKNETISILGKRGSGKSSFLLSILDDIKSDSECSQICVLDIIDPTMFENRQHVLITIISIIKSKIDNIGISIEQDENYFEWIKSLKQLAHGLQLLDGVGKHPIENESWNDPTIILEKGLNQAKAGFNLENSFHNFVENSLKLLKKNLFIIAFDDIDTDFGKGEKVLETIRKYLGSSKLITVIAGDIELFEKIIRQKKYKQFSPLLEKESNEYRIVEIHNQIDHLEEQYLLKVLPVRHRIQLDDIYSLLKKSCMFHFISSKEEVGYTLLDQLNTDKASIKKTDNSKDLFILLNERFFNISITFIKDYEMFIQALTRLPVRTIFQIVEAVILEKKEQDFLYLRDKFLNIFSSTLSKYNFDVRLISDQNFISYLTRKLLEFHLAGKLSIDQSYRCKPVYSDESERTLMLVTNILVNQVFKYNRANTFEYLTKTCLSRQLFLEGNKTELKSYFQFVGLTENEAPINSIHRFCSFIADSSNRSFLNHGFIKTHTLQKVVDKKNEVQLRGYDQLAWESAESSLNTVKDKFLFNILFTQVKHKSQTQIYASIYPLIALMSELLQDISIDLETFIERHIKLHSQSKKFNSFSSTEDTKDEGYDDPESELDLDDTISEEDLKSLTLELKRWVEFVRKESKTQLPVHILAKVWTRFYYSLDNIVRKKKSIGEIIELCIIQFIHSWIVEASLHIGEVTIDIRNITSSTNLSSSRNIFLNNYKNIFNYKGQGLSSLHVILKFPLWKYYLSPSIQAAMLEENLKHDMEKSRGTWFSALLELDQKNLQNEINALNKDHDLEVKINKFKMDATAKAQDELNVLRKKFSYDNLDRESICESIKETQYLSLKPVLNLLKEQRTLEVESYFKRYRFNKKDIESLMKGLDGPKKETVRMKILSMYPTG